MIFTDFFTFSNCDKLMQVKVNQAEKRSWLEVDLGQITTNLKTFQQALPRETNIMAVIKADAYGHGDIKVAQILTDYGVNMFAVSNIDEAVGLRKAGIRGLILILGYTSIAMTLHKLSYQRNMPRLFLRKIIELSVSLLLIQE